MEGPNQVANEAHWAEPSSLMPQYWRELWQSGRTGWDLGGPHPLLSTLIERASDLGLLARGACIYVPGCGSCHDGAALVAMGYEVLGQDFAPEAIAKARALHGSLERLSLEVGNALEVPGQHLQTFEAVYDRAMLCALRPEARPAFVAACAQRLKPGGLFLSLPFARLRLSEAEGPPFALPASELEATLGGRFTLVSGEERRDGAIFGSIESELVTVWRKRDQQPAFS